VGEQNDTSSVLPSSFSANISLGAYCFREALEVAFGSELKGGKEESSFFLLMLALISLGGKYAPTKIKC
jgi:hypothetical protein